MFYKMSSDDKEITVNHKEEIVDFISNLDRTENLDILRDIFYIFERNKIKYTTNNNGVYIKMGDINTETLEELVRFINFTINNRRESKQRQLEIAKSIAASKTLAEEEKKEEDEKKALEVKDEKVEESQGDKIVLKRKRKTFNNKGLSQLLKDCQKAKSNKQSVLNDKKKKSASKNKVEDGDLEGDELEDEDLEDDEDEDSSCDSECSDQAASINGDSDEEDSDEEEEYSADE